MPKLDEARLASDALLEEAVKTTMKLNFSEALLEKYQPHSVDEFVGIPKVKHVIQAFLRNPRSCAFLLLGPSGRGKTLMGLVMSQTLGAELHHIPSRSCDLETIEHVTRLCWNAPFNFKTGESCAFHFILVDEADQASKAAQMALLSKLDKTAFPPNTIMVFTANHTDQFEPRFVSRLMTLNFDAEGMDDGLAKLLTGIAKKEGVKDRLDFHRLGLDTNYNVRDAINKLELECMGSGYLREAGYLCKSSKRKK